MFSRGNLNIIDFNNLFNPILTFTIVCVSITKLNPDKFYKYYSFAGIIAMVLIFYQSYRLFKFGELPSPIKILPSSNAEIFYSWVEEYYRPTSIFTEPQAYASYFIPLLILSLNKNNLLFSLLIIVSILLSGSSTGILLIIILFFYYLSSKFKFKLKIFIFFILLLGIAFATQTEIFERQISKIVSISFENDIRLIKGFQIFDSFNFLNKLIGIGEGPIVLKHYNETHANILLSKNINDLDSYVTTISGLLISYGIFSLFIFFSLFFMLFKNENPKYRNLLLIILIASFAQTLLFNGFFILYYAIYFSNSNKNQFNTNYYVLNMSIK